MTFQHGEEDAFFERGQEDVRDPLVGTMVGHAYRVLGKLADGGMATIYEAEHERLRKRVALKVLRGASACDPNVVARFRVEARATSAIGHPNIVDITDFGACPDGSPFLVMERLVGEALDALLARERRLSIGRAVRIARQIAEALAAAHARGVVHRDIKPANVFLVERGGTSEFVKLLDFGISRFVEGLDGDPRMTTEGVAVGTPRYMAPEQADGSGTIDGRADLHALGAVLFRMLTGHDAFPGASIAETLFSVIGRTPPDVRDFRRDVPEGLAAVIARMLKKKPEWRFRDAVEVVDVLAPFVDYDDPPSAEIEVAPVRQPPTTRRARPPRWMIPQDPEVSVIESRAELETLLDRDENA